MNNHDGYPYTVKANNSLEELAERKKARRRAGKKSWRGMSPISRADLAWAKNARRESRGGRELRPVHRRAPESPAAALRTEAYVRAAILEVERQLERARTERRRGILGARVEALRAELEGIS